MPSEEMRSRTRAAEYFESLPAGSMEEEFPLLVGGNEAAAVAAAGVRDDDGRTGCLVCAAAVDVGFDIALVAAAGALARVVVALF